jgi:hypothetical protein
MRKSSLPSRWLNAAADKHVQDISNGTNCPLFRDLLCITGYHNPDCVEVFRKGANMYNLLEYSGLGEHVDAQCIASAEDLLASCFVHNTELLSQLSEDKHSLDLLRITRDDALLGRMSEPKLIEEVDLNKVLLHPRFASVRHKADGEIKIRAVDHFSWSPHDGPLRKQHSINGHAVANVKLKYSTLDHLVESMKIVHERSGRLPSLLKADIDAAYRRIPINPKHRWACWIAFKAQGKIWAAQHYACPFGAIGSVYAWESIASALSHLARRLLRLAVLHFVDDFFAAEAHECVEHALQCLVKLFRMLLGDAAVSDLKIDFGKALVILGVYIMSNSCGVRCVPAADKIQNWKHMIKEALYVLKRLPPGDASKLTGKLSWGGTKLFRRLGRAMLRALIDQQSRRDGHIGPELEDTLCWWLQVFELEIAEEFPWNGPAKHTIHLFCDASGAPPQLGAVLFSHLGVHWTSLVPDSSLLSLFRARKDKQIMGLEMLAIALGVSTFADIIRGSKLIIHCDNTGSEVAVRKGTAVRMDHAQLVHSMWLQLVELEVEVFVVRVKSGDNIADLPSRGDFNFLNDMQAKWAEPVLSTVYHKDETWVALQRRLAMIQHMS